MHIWGLCRHREVADGEIADIGTPATSLTTHPPFAGGPGDAKGTASAYALEDLHRAAEGWYGLTRPESRATACGVSSRDLAVDHAGGGLRRVRFANGQS